MLPLSGLDFSTALIEVYLPPFLHRLRHGLRSGPAWRRGDPALSSDELLQNPGPVALLGWLGEGKTTTPQYLTWLYASCPSDRPHWRLGELVPFFGAKTFIPLATWLQFSAQVTATGSRAASRIQ